jgi:hypothetical protein
VVILSHKGVIDVKHYNLSRGIVGVDTVVPVIIKYLISSVAALYDGEENFEVFPLAPFESERLYHSTLQRTGSFLALLS